MNNRRIQQFTPAEVQAMIEEDGESIAFIDVREPWEYASDTGHVKGSILIPMNQIPDNIERIREMARDKKIGIICNSGHRSYYATSFLVDNKIENVFNIEGGIIKWLLSDLGVEYGDAEPDQSD